MTTDPNSLTSRLQAALGTQYRLERELGRGGMGAVFLATDTTLDRPVAVKVMHPDLSVHGGIIQRFLAEARMIARLRHPGIVAVHTAGEATGIFYYVMDHVPGETLRERLNREPKLPPAEVARIVGDIADALDAAGQAGLVHRDVKPENILLDNATGRAMLADFGIARVAAAETSAQLTGEGVAVGTPTYMSPEQATGEQVDHQSDLYALGIVGYEMLAGAPPFRGPNGAAVISMQLAEKPVPISRLRPETPPALAAAIMRALEKSPANRWQTGADFCRGLHGTGAPAPARRRVPAGILGAIGLVLATAAVLALAMNSRDGPPDGVNPRHSILILPFNNLRDDASVEWLREGSVNMLSLNMSQWNDLSVTDHERLHDLLAKHDIRVEDVVGLDLARRLARDVGAWTVVLGDYSLVGDSLQLVARVYDVASGRRVDVAQIDGPATGDVRPLFDQLAARLLDLSGAPGEFRTGLAGLTTGSLEAYRSYLRGLDFLNQWDLTTAETEFRHAIDEDSTFALAYYKLALARGWLVGAVDSAGTAAIQAATRYADRLPGHEQTMIKAYRAFLDGDFESARGFYRAMLARDSNDADAWYGLGDALFHDTSEVRFASNWSESLRSFERVLQLDPGYTLAYEHILNMLTEAASETPYVTLTRADSFAFVHPPAGATGIDSARTARGVALARQLAVAKGREWVANQPDAIRAHTNLIEALIASHDYPTALAELSRLRSLPAGSTRADLAFLEGRILFASGDFDRAAQAFQLAMDTTRAEDFLGSQPSSAREVSSAAGAFSYLGDLKRAASALALADSVRQLWRPQGAAPDYSVQSALAALYASADGPPAELRRIWSSTAEAARSAPPERRPSIALSGAAAALGLVLGPADDTTALADLQALARPDLQKELRALLSLRDGRKEEARKILETPDTATHTGMKSGEGFHVDPRPFAAQAYFALGEYQRTVDVLRGFEPEHLPTRGFDARWAMVGKMRILRGLAFEKLGQPDAAATEYRAVLAQWKSPDPVLNRYLREAQRGLARTAGELRERNS